jgi:DNA-binding transcriptional ArsR family regulator
VSRRAAPAALDSDALDRTLQALAEPTRRAVVGLLRDGPPRASEIADALAMSRQAQHAQVAAHRLAGVIQEVGAASPDDDARARTYRLEAQPLADLQAWLGDVQAFWGVQMQAFRKQAERVGRERGTR